MLHISNKNSDTATNSPNKFDGPQYGNTTGNTLASVISKLRERQGIEELSKKIIDQDLSEANEDTSSISNNSKAHDLLVEEIGSNNVAVFQTLMKSVSNKDNSSNDNMKSQVNILGIATFLFCNCIKCYSIKYFHSASDS